MLQIIFLILLTKAKCNIRKKDQEINEKETRLYENYNIVHNQSISGAIKSEGNENMLRLLDTLDSGQLPGIVISAYEGSVARIPCVGILTLDREKIVWSYARSVQNLTFGEMEGNEMAVEDGKLAIFYVRQADAGVYQCQIGCTVGGLAILEVLNDKEKYAVVKPYSSRGPYPSPPNPITSELVAFSSWSAWSECSRCGLVGRRRRYGICYVGYGDVNQDMNTDVSIEKPEEESVLLQSDEIKLFQAFPGGIPCRSPLLPKTIRKLPVLGIRKNEIMIGLCKVPCKSKIFELRSSTGEVIESANNSDGVYSLRQKEPTQPPPVAREIIFAAKGTKVVVRCPGTTLRDIPFTWRVGDNEVMPRELDKNSGGRKHLNARDHIVFTSVQFSDSNVYSCWQGRNLAGVVKLRVFEDTSSTYGYRLMLVGLFVCLCVIWRLTGRMYHHQRRGSM